MSERCDLSDLPVEQCACRIHGPKETPPTGRFTGYAFEARYRSKCPACGEDIDPGDDICAKDGGFVHAECVSR